MDSELVRELGQAMFAAPDERQREALKILRGESSGPANERVEPFVTLKACATALGTCASTLWRYGVPGHELGGRRRFRVSEVLAYLETPEFRCQIETLKLARRKRTAAQGEKKGAA